VYLQKRLLSQAQGYEVERDPRSITLAHSRLEQIYSHLDPQQREKMGSLEPSAIHPRMLINGKLVEASDGKSFAVYSPATREKVADGKSPPSPVLPCCSRTTD
jgi:asparagine synthetase A